MSGTSFHFHVARPAPGTLAADEVQVWRLRVPPVGSEPAIWHDWLSVEERERIGRKRQAIDRQRDLTSRAGLRRLLGTYIGCSPGEIAFATGASGKPVLAPCPGGPRLEFNISHAGEWVLLAFAHARVGVDVEAWREIDHDEIVRHYFAPAEQAAWEGVPAAKRLPVFFSAWTRKEAYVKALGTGLTTPLDQFAVRFHPADAPAALLSCEEGGGEVQRWTLADCSPAPGYSGAGAVEAPAVRIGGCEFSAGGGAPAE